MSTTSSTTTWSEEPVRELYDRGLYLQALRAGEAALPLREWPGTRGKILAGRVANRLGARRLAERLHLEAWRADPGDAVALYYRAYALLNWRGPFAAWEFLERHAPDGAPTAPVVVQADLLAQRARVLAGLRDFERAERELARAEELTPGRPWLLVERSGVLEAEDRYPEALAASGRALEARPWYSPAVLQHAHLLVLREHDDEAAELLARALEHTENAAAATQRVTVLVELGRHDEAWRTLDRLEELAVLADPGLRQWIAAQRSELAYLRGDSAGALHWARQADTAFHARVAATLERSPGRTRKQLPVAFVRQHHMTCGPASLTALARFFGQPAAHLEVAEAICYGGTTAHSERRWAETNGFVAREFTVTQANVRALVDRGLPCVVNTVEVVSGHMQVLVGYDPSRETFLVRDPYQPARREWLAEEFLESYRAFGPRGMLLVPRARWEAESELAGLALDDSTLHDHLHRLQAALLAHDWPAAEAAQRALEAEAPGHRLVHEGRFALASYAQDPLAGLAAVEAWLAMFPDKPRLLHLKLRLLEDLGRSAERLELLTGAVGAPRADPIFRFELARELSQDGRTYAEAERQVRLALRRAPQDAGNLWLLARLAAERGEPGRAFELMRFAVCLEDTNETLAQGFFAAGFNAGRSDEAVALLRARFERFARRSSLPARSLFHALDALDRGDEAFAVLERALELRPEDGSLLLFAAVVHGNQGRTERAQELLARAGTRVHATELLRARADLAVFAGDLAAALAHCRAWTEREPLGLEAWQRVLWLVRASEGRARALEEVRALAARHPFHGGVQRLCIGELGAEAPAEELLVALLERHPTDAWARRELALRWLERGRLAEALASVREARTLEPRNPAGPGIEALIHERAGREAEALAAARAAVELSADHTPPVVQLVQRSWSAGQGEEALWFVHASLCKQRTNGTGILAWYDLARLRITDEELVAALQVFLDERPELWQAHAMLVRHRLASGALDEALATARTACERFALVADVWFARAKVHEARGEGAEQRAALESALAARPRWGQALRALAFLLEKQGALEESRRTLERAAALAPLEVENHWWLADTLLQLGRAEEALSRCEHALRLDPRSSEAWRLHTRSAAAAGRPERTLELMREATRTRPDDAAAWRQLARALGERDQSAEGLEAARHALALDASEFESVDLLACFLAEKGSPENMDEAGALLDEHAARFGPSVTGRGRRAWLAGKAGDTDASVRLFRELVKENPEYSFGWHSLLDTLADVASTPEYRAAASEFARLAPGDAVAQEYLGDACRRDGDPAGARAAFQRALVLSTSPYASGALFDLQLEDRQLEPARATLASHGASWEPEARALRSLQLASAAEDVPAVRACMQALLRERELAPGVLRSAAEQLDKAGHLDLLLELLEAELRDGRREVGEVWAIARARKSGWKAVLAPLLALPAGSPAMLGAAGEFLQGVIEERRHGLGRKLVRRREDELAKDPRGWCEVGRLWLATGKLRRCVRWMTPRERPGVEPWMLLTPAIALRNLRRRAEAERCTLHALTLPPDRSMPFHRLFLAGDAALRGDWAETQKWFAGARASGAWGEFLQRVLQAAVNMEASADLRAGFAACRQAFDHAVTQGPNLLSEPYLRAVHRACLRQVARRRGGAAWLWWLWKRL